VQKLTKEEGTWQEGIEYTDGKKEEEEEEVVVVVVVDGGGGGGGGQTHLNSRHAPFTASRYVVLPVRTYRSKYASNAVTS
jgi:hypothetical protein